MRVNACERDHEARVRVTAAVGGGFRTFEELRRGLKGLGRYATKEGCRHFLDALVRGGSLAASRHRLTTTGPLTETWGLPANGARQCRVCGCTDGCACAGGCRWVETDLCSSCA